MSDYKHILVGIDLSDESETVCQKAQRLAQASGAKLSVLHVVEPISLSYGGDLPMDFSAVQDEIREQAAQKLAGFGQHYGLGEQDQHIAFGRAAAEIHRFADQHGVDLIVVGSHGRSGIALLLGSTANGVLHGANCDVLAVRVQ